MLRPFQVSWWDDPTCDFSTSWPHWAIGENLLEVGDNQHIPQYCIFAAVMATDPEHAARLILETYEDDDPDIQWCEIIEQPWGWSPYSDNMPRKAWMVWDQRPH